MKFSLHVTCVLCYVTICILFSFQGAIQRPVRLHRRKPLATGTAECQWPNAYLRASKRSPRSIRSDFNVRQRQKKLAYNQLPRDALVYAGYHAMSSGPVPYSSHPPGAPAANWRADGDEETRTPDPRLAKAVLSQLSYIPGLRWAWLDSNQRPLPYQRNALTG